MPRLGDALPGGLLLAIGGVGAVGLALHRATVVDVVDAAFVLGIVPAFLAGGLLLALGYRVRADPAVGGRALRWSAIGAVAVGATADAVLLRTRAFEAPLDPALLLVSVAAVGAAGGATAAIVDGRRREEIQTLRSHARRAESTLGSVRGFAVARLDPEGFVDEWSAGAAEITGFGAEIVGTRIDALYPEPRRDDAKRDLQRALRTDRVDLEGAFTRAGGDTFHGVGSLTAVEDDGSLSGYVLVLADRSDEAARREQLERRNSQLEAFASVVSHDLRNPLNVAIGNVGMARTLDDGAEKLEIAENALERMERLIEEVLTLARQGRDVDEFERVDLEECIQLAWSSVDEMWTEIEYDDLPDVIADGERLRRLFENLFRNAVEHAGEDVTIRIGMLSDEEGIYVEDSGPGIPEHKRAEVFDAGYTTGDDGTGLGLAIVQSIVEAHGWEIEATEGSDGGARFEIRGVQTLADVKRDPVERP